MSKAEQLREMQTRINELEDQLKRCKEENKRLKNRPVTVADSVKNGGDNG